MSRLSVALIRCSVALIAACFWWCYPAQVLADSTVTVDTTHLLQNIVGFGASDAWQAYALHTAPAATQTRVLNLLFSPASGAGLSMLRHRIPTAIEPSPGQFDWTTDNDTIWLTQQAIARGVKTVWSTPWSPPAWMKSNNDVNNGGSLLPQYYTAYAQYLAAYILQYKALFGVTIDGISLQNEPDMNTTYESCLWTSQQFHDFIASALIPTFQADGITTKVIMPENAWWSDGLAAATLADPTTAAAVDVVASHDYGGGMSPFTDAMQLGKQVWETEVSNLGANDPSITDGLQWAISINNALVIGNVSAWNYWWLYDVNDTSGSALITSDPTQTILTVNKRLWTIGNYARFVRPGSNLIPVLANSPEPNIYLTAFRRVGPRKLILVAINNTNSTDHLTVNLPAFTGTSFSQWQTSATTNLRAMPSVPITGGAAVLTLAPYSVNSFVSNGAVVNPSVPIQIACGSNGAAPFLGDFDYDSGNTFTTSTTIDTSGVTNPAPEAVYQSQRWSTTPFTYDIKGLVTNVRYTVRLHFAETYATGPGQREFNVDINGSPVLTNFDVYAAAGAADKAVVEQFTARAIKGGQITISFLPGAIQNPMVSGIEVLKYVP